MNCLNRDSGYFKAWYKHNRGNSRVKTKRRRVDEESWDPPFPGTSLVKSVDEVIDEVSTTTAVRYGTRAFFLRESGRNVTETHNENRYRNTSINYIRDVSTDPLILGGVME